MCRVERGLDDRRGLGTRLEHVELACAHPPAGRVGVTQQPRRGLDAPFARGEQRIQVGIEIEPLPVAAARGRQKVGDRVVRGNAVAAREQGLRRAGECLQHEVVAPQRAAGRHFARAAQRRIGVAERQVQRGKGAQRCAHGRVKPGLA